jgi:predicted patatin/cPLA2 family phospholipase
MSSDIESAERFGPEHLAQNYTERPHPVIQMILSRSFQAHYEPGGGHHIALAVEGGGIAGATSAGMLTAMEQAKLLDVVDSIYGTSSGAINAAYSVSGQIARGSNVYEDLATPNFYSHKRWLRYFMGKEVTNFDWLFNEIITHDYPINMEGFRSGPKLVAIGTDVDTGTAVRMSDFREAEEIYAALRASSAIPILSGRHVKEFRGKRILDGALVDPIPYMSALGDGANYVLVLRSRGEDYLKEMPDSRQQRLTFLLGGLSVAKVLKDYESNYNQAADELKNGYSQNVKQIALEGNLVPITRFEKDIRKIRNGFKLGAQAVAKAFGAPDIDVRWSGEAPELVVPSFS